MEYLTVKEVGEKWAITGGMVTYYCAARRIKCTIKKSNLWLIIDNEEKYVNGRYKKNKVKDGDSI